MSHLSGCLGAGGSPLKERALVDGSILNRERLAAELHLDHAIRSDSDIADAAFRAWGMAALDRMRGEFALALINEESRLLRLIASRFGARSIYWTKTRQFYFSSELSHLMELSGERPKLDPVAVASYLANQPGGDSTLFKGVFRIPPAHLLEVNLETGVPIGLRPYWKWETSGDADLTLPTAAEGLHALLRDSIASHLQQGQDYGCSLSGGIDSSVLLGLACEAIGADKATAFTFDAGVPEAGAAAMSEVAAARTTARGLGVRLVEVAYHAEQLPGDFEQAVFPLDEPCLSPVLFADGALYASARKHSLAALMSGHGPDTLFAGGTNHYALQVAALLREGQLLPSLRTLCNAAEFTGRSTLRTAAAAAVASLPGGRGRYRRTESGLRGINREWLRQGIEPVPPSMPGLSKQVLREQLRQELESTSIPRVLKIECANARRSEMGAIFPYLTPEVAAFAGRLNSRLLIAEDGSSKAVLREVGRGLTPSINTPRAPRSGFSVPSDLWLHRLRRWAAERLREAQAMPIFDADVIEQTWTAWQAGNRASGETMLIWQWVLLSGWLRLHRVDFD